MESGHCDSKCCALAADLLPGDLSAHRYRGMFITGFWRARHGADRTVHGGETIEQRFHQQFAGAAGLLDETPLCAKGRYDVLLYCCSAAASPRPLCDTSTPSWVEQPPDDVLLRASSPGPRLLPCTRGGMHILSRSNGPRAAQGGVAGRSCARSWHPYGLCATQGRVAGAAGSSRARF